MCLSELLLGVTSHSGMFAHKVVARSFSVLRFVLLYLCVYVCVGLFVLGMWGGWFSFSTFWSFLATLPCTCTYMHMVEDHKTPQ